MKEIKYNGYDWYVIKEDNEKALLFMKNRLSKEEMGELFDRSLLDDDNDVKFSYTRDNWRWADSPIRHVLNSKWLSKFNKDELVQMTTTVELNGEKSTTRDYVRLLTEDEMEDLPIEVNKADDEWGYWLSSPSLFYNGIAYERRVTATGGADDNLVDNSFGVRPAVSIKHSTLSTCISEYEAFHESYEPFHENIEKLNITQEKNSKGNWKWKCEGYNISTPQKIMGDKINEIIDYIKENKND